MMSKVHKMVTTFWHNIHPEKVDPIQRIIQIAVKYIEDIMTTWGHYLLRNTLMLLKSGLLVSNEMTGDNKYFQKLNFVRILQRKK